MLLSEAVHLTFSNNAAEDRSTLVKVAAVAAAAIASYDRQGGKQCIDYKLRHGAPNAMGANNAKDIRKKLKNRRAAHGAKRRS